MLSLTKIVVLFLTLKPIIVPFKVLKLIMNLSIGRQSNIGGIAVFFSIVSADDLFVNAFLSNLGYNPQEKFDLRYLPDLQEIPFAICYLAM